MAAPRYRIVCTWGQIGGLSTALIYPGRSGLIGLAGVMGAYGSMCGQRLSMKPQG